MPHTIIRHRRSVAAALPLIVLGLILAGCGSTSGAGSTATATTSASHGSPVNADTAPGHPAGRGLRAAKFRECLANNGIALPKRTRRRGGVGGILGASKLPSGVSRKTYEAAAAKCGGTPRAGRFGDLANRPKTKAALANFAACMREHGVPLPAPNISGEGPIFNTSAINSAARGFKAAESECAYTLRGAFGPRRGGAGAEATPSG